MTSETVSPEIGRIRAYFAPVDRVAQQATVFDPSVNGRFDVDAPPSPWVDLGWISGFERDSQTHIVGVRAGSPSSTQMQARDVVDTTLKLCFASWGKLQLSLSSGTQQMNLLAPQTGVPAAGSGGHAVSAAAILPGATESSLPLSLADAAGFAVGGLVAVDVDYSAPTTGFVGSGVSGAYVRTALTDVNYVRRITLNVARVASIQNGVLALDRPLLAGVPTSGMKVSAVLGFCDREGSSFFQEWSALFVAEGQQGERVLWHYPRLQAMAGISESPAKGPGGYQSMRLSGSFRALPITDPVDGEKVLCFRTYLASPA